MRRTLTPRPARAHVARWLVARAAAAGPARFVRVRRKDASPNSRRRRSASTNRSRRSSCPQHPVPRAKFPVVDIHSHQPTPMSARRIRPGRSRRWKRSTSRSSSTRADPRATGCISGLDAIKAQQVQGPDGAVRERRISATSGRASAQKAAAAARRRHQGRRDGPEDRKDLGHVRPARPTAAACRSTTRSSIRSGRRCARLNDSGADSHRRAAGVLRAAGLQQRALARAGAVSGPAPPDRRPRSSS